MSTSRLPQIDPNTGQRVPGPPRVPKPPKLREHPRQRGYGDDDSAGGTAAPRPLPPTLEYSRPPVISDHCSVGSSAGLPQLPARTPQSQTGEAMYENEDSTDKYGKYAYAYVSGDPDPYPEDSLSSSVFSGGGSRSMDSDSRNASSIVHEISTKSNEQEPPLSLDLYIGSNFVFALNENNFADVAANPYPSIVMFYNPFEAGNQVPKAEFKLAADTKRPEYPQFGAVDCKAQGVFCSKLGITSMPMYKVFAEGKEVSSVRDTNKFGAKEMTQFLDTLASINQENADKARSFSKPTSSCGLAKIFGFKK